MKAKPRGEWLDSRLEDSPYNLERRLSASEIVLRYGDTKTLERWRLWSLPSIQGGNYRIKVAGRFYRFVGRLDK